MGVGLRFLRVGIKMDALGVKRDIEPNILIQYFMYDSSSDYLAGRRSYKLAGL